MKSADAFHGDDLTAANDVGRRRARRRGRARADAVVRSPSRGAEFPAVTRPEFELRAADRTRIGLRVKAAVVRIVVFRLARRTHRERLHRRVRAVVGQRFDDAEARAAVRAVRERVAVATVRRIKDFAQTIRAGGDVRQHQRGLVAAGASLARISKRLVADRIEPGGFAALDETARRLFGFEPEKKLFQRVRAAFDFDEDALRRIVDPARQPKFRWRADKTNGRKPTPCTAPRTASCKRVHLAGAAESMVVMNCGRWTSRHFDPANIATASGGCFAFVGNLRPLIVKGREAAAPGAWENWTGARLLPKHQPQPVTTRVIEGAAHGGDRAFERAHESRGGPTLRRDGSALLLAAHRQGVPEPAQQAGLLADLRERHHPQLEHDHYPLPNAGSALSPRSR